MDSPVIWQAFERSKALAPAWAVSMRTQGGALIVTDERGRDWQAKLMTVSRKHIGARFGTDFAVDVIVPVYGPMEGK